MSIKQLLHNYTYLLIKHREEIPKDKADDIEFFDNELKQVEQITGCSQRDEVQGAVANVVWKVIEEAAEILKGANQ